ncbi:MAG: FAD-dependent oxidoreductase [Bacteroidota bacterium]|nr:FAD-dependent oxidoreductase [Bacteroidota bacterium]MDP4274510.1 FAD-dependent oxidoreductase [Bacteroidota bacterium]
MKKIKLIISLISLSLGTGYLGFSQILVETESFQNKGGWVVDQQFMDLMGSPYLMAHGIGTPVADASTSVKLPKKGTYHVFVRTKNWTAYWTKNEAPGKFKVIIDGKVLQPVFGTQGAGWDWQDGGTVRINSVSCRLVLHDLTGFDGRCDAIILSNDPKFWPSNNLETLSTFRKKALQLPDKPEQAGEFDFVVVGGGIAGTCAAISAARLGLKVALIQDRPLLGGNNSSEVRVHLGGRINLDPYPALGNIVNEIGPVKFGNAQPASNYEDQKKLDVVSEEKNITLFLDYRAFAVEKDGQKIVAVVAKNILNSKELRFTAPIFADCTGDGTIGFLAGADFLMGRESRNDFGEPTAPEVKDKMTMGSSVQWRSEEKHAPVAFPDIAWGLKFNEQNVQKLKTGDWKWETGMNFDQVKDFEKIRDYGLLVVYSNWAYLKNHYSGRNDFSHSKLQWVAYIAGKRESRRLLGDYVLREQDLTESVKYPDGTAPTSWTIDLHYPDPKNSKSFPGEEFLAISKQKAIYPYPVPYRCLYSRNVSNLFMAGRDISVTHIALGTVRVMRTTGMLGEVVGMAASICKNHQVLPRAVYDQYFEELRKLMNLGTGKAGIPQKQNYNLGNTLLKGVNVH